MQTYIQYKQVAIFICCHDYNLPLQLIAAFLEDAVFQAKSF